METDIIQFIDFNVLRRKFHIIYLATKIVQKGNLIVNVHTS